MKLIHVILIGLLVFATAKLSAQSTNVDANVLVGSWKLDLSPEDPNDDNFAKMIISAVEENSIKGFFYRDGVKIKEGRLKISEGIIYAALVSGDNSGTYNTSFYFKDGVLRGTTHSIDRDFLAVWKGERITE